MVLDASSIIFIIVIIIKAQKREKGLGIAQPCPFTWNHVVSNFLGKNYSLMILSSNCAQLQDPLILQKSPSPLFFFYFFGSYARSALKSLSLKELVHF